MSKLIEGSKYTKKQIANFLSVDDSSIMTRKGYYKVGEHYFIFTNIGVPSTDIDGKVFDYNNILLEDGRSIFWEGANNETFQKGRLKEIYDNPDKVWVFIRTQKFKASKGSVWEFHGKLSDIKCVNYGVNPQGFILLFDNNKYDSSHELTNHNFEEDSSGMTGFLAEKWFLEQLMVISSYKKDLMKRTNTNFGREHILWQYLLNKKANHDISIKEDIFIEVKGSTSKKEQGFRITESEMNLKNSLKKNSFYFLVNVWNVGRENVSANIYSSEEIDEYFKLNERKIWYAEKNK